MEKKANSPLMQSLIEGVGTFLGTYVVYAIQDRYTKRKLAKNG